MNILIKFYSVTPSEWLFEDRAEEIEGRSLPARSALTVTQ